VDSRIGAQFVYGTVFGGEKPLVNGEEKTGLDSGHFL
jgi:hypothetical protein